MAEPRMVKRTHIAFIVFMLALMLIIVMRGAGAEDSGYGTYESLTEELRDLVSSHPEVCIVVDLGRSWENRTIWGIKISDLPERNDPAEPDILFLGCIHGDEKIAFEVVIGLLRRAVEGCGVDQELTSLIDRAELWFVPMLNPDGYEHDTRKNARDNNQNGYFDQGDGVDLNRDFDFHWAEIASSSDPSSPNYSGPYAFSEPETQTLQDLASGVDFEVAVSFHSYGEMVLYPWGYSAVIQSAKSDLLYRLAIEMASQIITSWPKLV
jgi:carboxypeptidase T